jgi:photosystem II stability/assembly factor-like uncharacterized protein
MKKYFILYIIIFFNCILFAGEGWTELNTGLTVKLNSASSFYYSPVWVCGDSGKVVRSTNSGANWINVNSGLPSSYSLITINCLYSGKTFVSGFNGTNSAVWMTRNDGGNWTQVFNLPNDFINVIYMKDTTTGIIIGNPVGGRWSIWKTTNGGFNWDSIGLYLPGTASEKGWANSFSHNGDDILFGTNNYKIYHSTNFGMTWQAQSTGVEQNIYCIYKDLAGGINLLRTTNGGSNWFVITSPGSGNISGISSIGGWIWLTRAGNTVYCSSNNGSSWYNAYTAPNGNYTNLCVEYNSLGTDFYATKNNGTLTLHRSFIGVKPISTEIPQQFSLSQNYPNPFNPSTKIKFDIPAEGKGQTADVKLIVYNSLGQQVAILVNQKLSPGTYEVEWNGNDFPSGIYFCKLTSGEYSQTVKMLLLK